MDSTSPQRVLSGKQDVPIKSASKHDKSEITVRSMERKPKIRNTEQVSGMGGRLICSKIGRVFFS